MMRKDTYLLLYGLFSIFTSAGQKAPRTYISHVKVSQKLFVSLQHNRWILITRGAVLLLKNQSAR